MAPSSGKMTLTAEKLNKTDIGILELLHEGRGSPRYIADELGKQQPYINQRLKRLLEHGHVEKIDRGLYQLSQPLDEDEGSVSYRRKALETYGEECAECGETEGVEIHHINRNREDNRVENLIPLCRPCHRSLHNDGDTVTYQFQAEDETWTKWKNTVPRSKSLEQRITELIEADAEGRIQPSNADNIAESGSSVDAGDPTVEEGQKLAEAEEVYVGPDEETRVAEDVIRDLDLSGSGSKYEDRVNAMLAFYEYLRDHRGERVSKGDLKELAENTNLEIGYASFGSLWNNWVKSNASQNRDSNTLTQLPGVEMDGDDYVYTGENDE